MARQVGRAVHYLCVLLVLGLLVLPYPGSRAPLLAGARPSGSGPEPGPKAPTQASPSGGTWMRLGPLPTDRDLSWVSSWMGRPAGQPARRAPS